MADGTSTWRSGCYRFCCQEEDYCSFLLCVKNILIYMICRLYINATVLLANNMGVVVLHTNDLSMGGCLHKDMLPELGI